MIGRVVSEIIAAFDVPRHMLKAAYEFEADRNRYYFSCRSVGIERRRAAEILEEELTILPDTQFSRQLAVCIAKARAIDEATSFL